MQHSNSVGVITLLIAIGLGFVWLSQYKHDRAVRTLCEEELHNRLPLESVTVSDEHQRSMDAFNLYTGAAEGPGTAGEMQRMHFMCVVHGGQRLDRDSKESIYLYKLVTTYY